MLDSLLFVLFFLFKKNTKRVVFGFLAEKKQQKKSACNQKIVSLPVLSGFHRSNCMADPIFAI
jgi:uncharacterized protein YbaA (DUF1428 family)